MTLKEQRLAAGMTQIDVAKAVGVSMNTYALWERGAMNPTPANAEKLREVFDAATE